MSSTQEEQLKETTESSEKNSEQPDDDDEEDLEKLQAEIAKMEEEAERIQRQYKEQQQKSSGASAGLVGNTDGNASSATSISLNGAVDGATAEKKDSQSIYVGQVEYSATPEELLAHFEACGVVERVTIVCDKMSGRPKGFAYLEFQTEEAVANAIKLDGSTFKDRTLVVKGKRVNEPGFARGGRGRGRGDGRGRFGRGFYRGGYRGGGGRGGRGGGRGGGGYHPYY